MAASQTGQNRSFFDNPKAAKILSKLILRLINDELQVYIDGLGILYIEKKEERKNYFRGTQTVCSEEIRKYIVFEKCYEVSSFEYNKHKNIIEPRELAARFISRLKKHTPTKANISQVTKELRRFFNEIRTELLLSGKSERLGDLGTLYALKLNQELNWQDKFASADIIFSAKPIKTRIIKEQYRFETPVLKSSTEPLTTSYQKLIKEGELNLLHELTNIGYPIDLPEAEATLKFDVFSRPNPDDSNIEELIYCTNGAASLAHRHDRNQRGNEFIVRTLVDKGTVIPSWPEKLLLLGWLLGFTSKSKHVNTGVLINFDFSDILKEQNNLSGAFTAPLALLPGTYLSLSGRFRYINILGISETETNFATKFSTNDLAAVLRLKNWDQFTKLERKATLRL